LDAASADMYVFLLKRQTVEARIISNHKRLGGIKYESSNYKNQNRYQNCRGRNSLLAVRHRFGVIQKIPIIRRNPLPGVARIFNSAVLPYEEAYIGVFAWGTDQRDSVYLSGTQQRWNTLGI